MFKTTELKNIISLIVLHQNIIKNVMNYFVKVQYLKLNSKIVFFQILENQQPIINHFV